MWKTTVALVWTCVTNFWREPYILRLGSMP